MTRPRLALLNAAHEGHHTSRNFRRDVPADLVEFDAVAGEVPADTVFDGCLVTGSRSSVYHDEDWIAETKAWVREALAEDLPTLGVCWGHQLLADVLGGRVEDMGEYELGYRTVSHEGGRLFEGVDEEFLVFTTHSDRVAELPPGAELLAENDYGVHAFRKDQAFGVQFHPEYDQSSAARVTRGKDLPDERIESVLDGVTRENYLDACGAKQVFDNFVDHVVAVQSGDEGGTSSAAADD
jgi:GMP synthase (glutamine-hydrolysing)